VREVGGGDRDGGAGELDRKGGRTREVGGGRDGGAGELELDRRGRSNARRSVERTEVGERAEVGGGAGGSGVDVAEVGGGRAGA